jgi:quinohemoprotein ethanol dehydrogenase
MQALKNGLFYVIDCTTGRVISADKLGKVTWAERIDLKTGRPVEAPGIRYKDNGIDSTMIWPSAFGMHNWQAMSFDPVRHLAYIPTMKLGMSVGANWDIDPRKPGDGTATLLAWDPVTQKKRWEVDLDESFWNGGTLATAANLVFQGTGSGYLNAYNATTGEKLWSLNAGLGINAAPMTYAVNGVQYVAVVVGYGGTINVTRVRDYGWRYGEQPRRVLAFALGKSITLPPGQPPRFTVKAIDDPSFVIDAKQADRGAKVSESKGCGLCHGIEMRNIASFARDLRESTLALGWEGFKSVVQGGAFFPLGMPKFGDLSDEELLELFMYIRQSAREAAHSSCDDPGARTGKHGDTR